MSNVVSNACCGVMSNLRWLNSVVAIHAGRSRAACRCLVDKWLAPRTPVALAASGRAAGRFARRSRVTCRPDRSGCCETSTRVVPTAMVSKHLPPEREQRPDAGHHERHHQPGEQPIRMAVPVRADHLHDEHRDQRVPGQAHGRHRERHPAGGGIDRQPIGQPHAGAIGHGVDRRHGRQASAGPDDGGRCGISQSVARCTTAARRSARRHALPEQQDQPAAPYTTSASGNDHRKPRPPAVAGVFGQQKVRDQPVQNDRRRSPAGRRRARPRRASPASARWCGACHVS